MKSQIKTTTSPMKQQINSIILQPYQKPLKPPTQNILLLQTCIKILPENNEQVFANPSKSNFKASDSNFSKIKQLSTHKQRHHSSSLKLLKNSHNIDRNNFSRSRLKSQSNGIFQSACNLQKQEKNKQWFERVEKELQKKLLAKNHQQNQKKLIIKKILADRQPKEHKLSIKEEFVKLKRENEIIRLEEYSQINKNNDVDPILAKYLLSINQKKQAKYTQMTGNKLRISEQVENMIQQIINNRVVDQQNKISNYFQKNKQFNNNIMTKILKQNVQYEQQNKNKAFYQQTQRKQMRNNQDREIQILSKISNIQAMLASKLNPDINFKYEPITSTLLNPKRPNQESFLSEQKKSEDKKINIYHKPLLMGKKLQQNGNDQSFSKIQQKVITKEMPNIKKQLQQKKKAVKQIVQVQEIKTKNMDKQMNAGKINDKTYKLQNQGKKVKKQFSYYENVSNISDQIEQIKLFPQPKSIAKQTPLNKKQNQKNHQSFTNILDSSIESQQQPKINIIKNQPPAPEAGQIKTKPLIPKQLSDEDKKKKLLQQKINEIKNKIAKFNLIDEDLMSIGSVLVNCSKMIKKSKIQWRLAAILLYRYCYDFYLIQSISYAQALKIGIIRKEQFDRHLNQNQSIRQTMDKVVKTLQKKIQLNKDIKMLLQSNESNLQKLRPLIDNEVKKFIVLLSQSNESNELPFIQCALYMINAVLVTRKLTDNPSIKIITRKIQQVNLEEGKKLFKEWGQKMFSLFDAIN